MNNIRIEKMVVAFLYYLSIGDLSYMCVCVCEREREMVELLEGLEVGLNKAIRLKKEKKVRE